MPRELEVADDLGPQQTHHIRENRESEARENLLADRRASDHRTPLEHQYPAARPGEVRGGHETVVAGADDDRVIGALRSRCWR